MVRLAATTLAIVSMSGSAQQMPLLRPTALTSQGSSARGERLFTERTSLRSGGPACISCHTIAGTAFPGGGALGPDLTHAYRKLGPRGTQSAMQTLYFKVMTPIYSAHPLVPEEQADLMAFLEQAESRQEPPWRTQLILLIALLLGGGFVALTGFFWRDRVKSVRRALVERATGLGARV
jgi:ubiquinol-cytochrome c reductase cytochrome c subunit